MASVLKIPNQPITDDPDVALRSQSIGNDNSEQASSIFDTRSPRSSATSSVPPRAEEWDRTLRHVGLEEFGKSLERAAKAVYPNGQKSRYSRVYVLLLRWKTEDPKLPVEREISELRRVLEEVYHYEIEDFWISDSDSHAEVSEKINAFVKVNNNSSDDLKIVYYAGHSRLSRSKELLWSTQPLKNEKCSIVVWSGIQRSLEMAQSDILILLDCCSSGLANASEGNGITELICACAFDVKANGVGHYSFTQALITELRFLSKKPCFSIGELYTSIYTRIQSYLPQGIKNERYPAPIHLVLTEGELSARGIKLSIQRTEEGDRSLERDRPKRVRYADEDPPNDTQEDDSTCSPRKRPRSNPSSRSRMDELILRWLDSSEPREVEDCYTEEPKKDEQSSTVTDPLSPRDAPRALFAIRFRDDIRSEDLSVELFREWLRSIPAAAEDVRVEAGFKCFSTLVLITVPLSICSYIPSHEAVYFLGSVKSSIILPMERRETTPFRDADEISSCASATALSNATIATSALSNPTTAITAFSNAFIAKAMSPPRARRTSRPKIKTGCNTCKNRRVKCDETRPQCIKCVRSGRTCSGYLAEKRISGDSGTLPTPPASVASTSIATANPVAMKESHELELLNHPTISPLTPSSHIFGTNTRLYFDAREALCFHIFQEHAEKELLGFFDSGFWSGRVIQASQSEPSIRHTVIALGALYQTLDEVAKSSALSNDNDYTAQDHYHFALQQYGKALTGLRNSIQMNETRSPQVIIMCIILFACFQSFIGDHKGMRGQIQAGLGMLEEVHSRESKTHLGGDAMLDDQVVQTLRRFAIQAILYDTIFHLPPDLKPQFSIYPSTALGPILQNIQVPEAFETSNQARIVLDSICESIMRFKETRPDKEANSPTSVWFNFKAQLETWSDAFQQLFIWRVWSPWSDYYQPSIIWRRLPDLTDDHRMDIVVLKSTKLMASILFSTDIKDSEMNFDSFYDQFEEIVELVKEVVVVEQELGLATKKPFLGLEQDQHGMSPPASFSNTKASFTPVLRVVPPLFVVAIKCRNRLVRREAIQLLLSRPRREGLWDSLLCGSVAERIVETEEEGMEPFDHNHPNTHAADNLPEEKRVVIKQFSSDLQSRTGTLRIGPGGPGHGDGNEDSRERVMDITW